MTSGVNFSECGVDIGDDIPHLWAPECVALDLDRTLLDTPRAITRLAGVLEQCGVEVQLLYDAQANVEADGGTFSPITFMRQHLSASTFNAVGQYYIQDDGHNLAYPDVANLLDRLHDVPITPNLLITYGVNSLWQAMKAPLSTYEGYMGVVPGAAKGSHIDGWRGASGTFDFLATDGQGNPIAVYHTRSVKLVDDKAVAFNDLPLDCTGAYVRRPSDKQLPSQGTEIPKSAQERVTTVGSLGQVSIDKYVEFAPCSGNDSFDSTQIFAFRPIADTNRATDLYIGAGLSFDDMREQVEPAYSAT